VGNATFGGISSGVVLALGAGARGMHVAKPALYEPRFIVDGTRTPVGDDFVPCVRDVLAAGDRSRSMRDLLVLTPEPLESSCSSGVRPARTSSTICCRNSSGQERARFAIVDSFLSQGELVSTEPGLHTSYTLQPPGEQIRVVLAHHGIRSY
jgi:hypothetical protein